MRNPDSSGTTRNDDDDHGASAAPPESDTPLDAEAVTLDIADLLLRDAPQRPSQTSGLKRE